MIPAFVYWIVGGFLLSGIGFYLFAMIFAANRVYILTLKRESKAHWGREVSFDDEEHIKMDNEGMAWNRANIDKKQDVHIVSKGLNLYGEYYDFGSDKCVMVLSGRTESLRYGYYFAKPYSEYGLNVLVVDPRAHGESDGEFNTVGFEESGDALEWVKFLHEEKGITSVVFHGICIGAAGGVFALTSPKAPQYIDGIVTEGMFVNFGESVNNHLKERNKQFFLLLDFIDMWMRLHTGHSMKYGPIDVMDKMEKPILMLQSREDKYSTPHNAQKLYDKCTSQKKKLVYFEKGAHSLVRVNATEKYDGEIKLFLSDLYENVNKTEEKEMSTNVL